MKLSEMVVGQKIIVQVSWGQHKTEIHSEVISKDDAGVYVAPYMHQGIALDINIDGSNGIVCNMYTDDPNTKERISWKNIKVKTVKTDNGFRYHLSTSGYNDISNNDERRKHERILLHKNGQLLDPNHDLPLDVLIHDISDVGISFYAPQNYQPSSNQLSVYFRDYIGDNEYNIKVDCAIVRSLPRAGSMFYGCRTVGDNKDYLLYDFMKRLKKKEPKESKEAHTDEHEAKENET